MPNVFQAGDYGQERAARANAEHSDTYDHKGEVVPQGDGKQPDER
jgi:hypothetical protein